MHQKSFFERLISLGSAKYKKYITLFWSAYVLIVLLVVSIFALLANGKLGFMPDFRELEDPKLLLASELISSDGEILGKYYRENRTEASFSELSPELVKALIATEDYRFQDHAGIDFKSLPRVFAKTILMNRSTGGGSTITQQLAKLLFPRQGFSGLSEIALRKFKEWVIAIKLERSFTKREIMTMYLNKFDFLNLAVGVKSASSIYFNKSTKELSTKEAAMLIGMAKNPAIFNPLRRPERTKHRRNVVLAQMKKYGFLSPLRYDSLRKEDLGLDVRLSSHRRGKATYFREFMRRYLSNGKPNPKNYRSFQKELFERNKFLWENDPLYGWCHKNLHPDGRPYDIYKDGLKIYTTIDSRIQEHAESAIKKHLKRNIQPAFNQELEEMAQPPFSDDLEKEQIEYLIYNSIKRTDKYRELTKADKDLSKEEILAKFNEPLETKVFTWAGERDTVMSALDEILHMKKFLRSSLYSVDPRNGHVKAYVGGPDIAYFNYDMTTLGKRQVGSTIKPFLYTVAVQNGISPCRKIPNTQISFVVNDTVWSPRNAAENENTQTYESLNWGLAHSVNTMSSWLMQRFGPKSVCDLLYNMGVRSKIHEVVSMYLGTSEMTIQELTDAFSVFANKGVYNQPMYVTKIEDRYGNTLAKFSNKSRAVISEHESRVMVDMLIDVVQQGTGRRLRNQYIEYANLADVEIAGKTGTTQAHSDGIFVGLVPKLVTGVWTGGEERSIRFNDLRQGQGSNLALPIFGYLMNGIYSDSTIGISRLDTFDIPLHYEKYGCDASFSEHSGAALDTIEVAEPVQEDEIDFL